MEEHEDFKKLIRLVSTPEKKLDLWERAWAIWISPSDPNYAHPMDVFLAVYLYALSEVATDDPMVRGLIRTISYSRNGQFFNSKCVAQSLCDKKYKFTSPAPVEPQNTRCRVCNSMVDTKRCAIYRYTSRYIGDGGTSAPKLFSLCEDCLAEGLRTINEKDIR